jgi:ABC-type transporter Mla maintaining outer membrane lipid asymmetry ATPase subunit MlaF
VVSTIPESHDIMPRLEGRLVFDGFRLIVEPGERVGLVGPSGSTGRKWPK